MPQEDFPKVSIGVSVPIELRTELVKLARGKYRSVSAACRAFIEDGVRREREVSEELDVSNEKSAVS